MIIYDFAFYLTLVVLLTGIVSLIDCLFFAKKRQANNQKKSMFVDYCRSFFPVLLIVWVIRSFIVQPYRVPTGSLEPTILPGDFIAVNQFAYGLKFPIGNFTLVKTGEPKRGDIALFRYPLNPNVVFVKRVIGLPGDHIVYQDKVLSVNGQQAKQALIKSSFDYGNGPGQIRAVNVYEENLAGVKHKIFVQPVGGELKDIDFVVPEGQYFMMGDNRDNSDDSRFWGTVPEHNLIGRAFGIWMSWDPVNNKVRWNRIGDGV